MRNKATIGAAVESQMSFGRRLPVFPSDARRLLTAAALLHLALAFGLFCAGRAQVAPSLIDREGIMGSFAFDSYEYQKGSVRLVEVLRQGDLAAWAGASEPVHVKLLSVWFALLGPLIIYSRTPVNC